MALGQFLFTNQPVALARQPLQPRLDNVCLGLAQLGVVQHAFFQQVFQLADPPRQFEHRERARQFAQVVLIRPRIDLPDVVHPLQNAVWHHHARQRHIPVLGRCQDIAGANDTYRILHLGGQLVALRLVHVVQALGRRRDVHVKRFLGRGARLQLDLPEHLLGKIQDVLRRVHALQRSPDHGCRVPRSNLIAGCGIDDAHRSSTNARFLCLDKSHARPLLRRDTTRRASTAQPGAHTDQQGFGLRARQTLGLENLVHQVLQILHHVAHRRRRVAQAHHRQLADGRADQVRHRILESADQPRGIEHPLQVVNQPGAERKGAARRRDVEVVQQRTARRQLRVPRRQAAAQRPAHVIQPRRLQLGGAHRIKRLLEQVRPHRLRSRQHQPGNYHQHQPSPVHDPSYCTRRRPRASMKAAIPSRIVNAPATSS